MTREEHITRAMLLDRRYDHRVHMYVDWANQKDRFLDADTLEVTSRDVFQERLTAHFDKTNPRQAQSYRKSLEAQKTHYGADVDD